MKKCITCGEENLDHRIYCSHCGTEIDRLLDRNQSHFAPRTEKSGIVVIRSEHVSVLLLRIIAAVIIFIGYILFLDYIGTLVSKGELTTNQGYIILYASILAFIALSGFALFWSRKIKPS